jgi:hypothetical protein
MTRNHAVRTNSWMTVKFDAGAHGRGVGDGDRSTA